MRHLAEAGWFVWTSIEPQIGIIRGTGDPLLAWAVIGGESGPGARAFDIRWPRYILAERKRLRLATFVKQLGANPQEIAYNPQEIAYISDETEAEQTNWMRDGWTWIHESTGSHWRRYLRLKDRKGGDMLEWPADLRVREFPKVVSA